jgi:hypothetical protein
MWGRSESAELQRRLITRGGDRLLPPVVSELGRRTDWLGGLNRRIFKSAGAHSPGLVDRLTSGGFLLLGGGRRTSSGAVLNCRRQADPEP